MVEESGGLTKNHREYLRGEVSKTGNDKWTTDSRIRDRIRAGIGDFPLLCKQLPPKDRKQIYETRPRGRNPEDKVGKESAVMHGTKYMIAFTYLGMRDRGYTTEEIERIFEEGVRSAEIQREEEIPELSGLLNVDISVDIQREETVDEEKLKQRFEDNEPLTSEQLSFLLHNDHITSEELVEYADKGNNDS